MIGIWASLHVEDSTMDRINLPFFYQLGSLINPLSEKKVEDSNGFDILLLGLGAGSAIRTLLNTYPSLTVCKASGEDLIASVNTGLAQWRKYMDLPEEQRVKAKPISDEQMLTVITKATTFQTILTAELQTLAAYQVTEKALFSTTRLIERAENILPQDILLEVPPETREDINQAGRCLAFDLPTAVGFHIWRAVEVVLKMYCREFNAKPKGKGWGSYIAALETTQANSSTVAVLDQIRELHRNPTMHPDIALSINEATGLFGIAPSVIIAVVNDIRRHRATASPASVSQSEPNSSEP